MTAKSTYLLAYNAALTGGWAYVLYQVVRSLSAGAGLPGVFEVGSGSSTSSMQQVASSGSQHSLCAGHHQTPEGCPDSSSA